MNRHLRTIDQATKRMSVLVKALLMYARIGRDQKLALTDLNRTISEVLSDLENLILHSKAKIFFEPLPILNVYEVEFRQLLQNLITNAIKFSKKKLIRKFEFTVEMKVTTGIFRSKTTESESNPNIWIESSLSFKDFISKKNTKATESD